MVEILPCRKYPLQFPHHVTASLNLLRRHSKLSALMMMTYIAWNKIQLVNKARLERHDMSNSASRDNNPQREKPSYLMGKVAEISSWNMLWLAMMTMRNRWNEPRCFSCIFRAKLDGKTQDGFAHTCHKFSFRRGLASNTAQQWHNEEESHAAAKAQSVKKCFHSERNELVSTTHRLCENGMPALLSLGQLLPQNIECVREDD